MITSNSEIPDTGFLRIKQILRFIPVSKSTWWEGTRTGKFPKPVKLGERTTAWKAQDIKDLIDKLGLSNSHEVIQKPKEVSSVNALV